MNVIYEYPRPSTGRLLSNEEIIDLGYLPGIDVHSFRQVVVNRSTGERTFTEDFEKRIMETR